MAETTTVLGMLTLLEFCNLGATIINARQLGTDETARKRAGRALARVDRHEERYHDERHA